MEEMKLESILLPGIDPQRPIVIAGPCSAALRNIEKGASPASMSKALFSCIGNSLEK